MASFLEIKNSACLVVTMYFLYRKKEKPCEWKNLVYLRLWTVAYLIQFLITMYYYYSPGLFLYDAGIF